MARIRLRQDRLQQLCQQHGLLRPTAIDQKKLADALDVHLASIDRLVTGRGGAGPTVIASALRYFDVSFDELFEVDDTPRHAVESVTP